MNLNNYGINQLYRAYKNINKEYLVFKPDSIKATNKYQANAVLNDIDLKKFLRKELINRLHRITGLWAMNCYTYNFNFFLNLHYGITENMYQSLLKIEGSIK